MPVEQRQDQYYGGHKGGRSSRDKTTINDVMPYVKKDAFGTPLKDWLYAHRILRGL